MNKLISKLNNAFLISGVLFLSSCGLGIKTVVTKKHPPLDAGQEIRVLDVRQSVPANAETVGTVRIYDIMTMKCDSATVYNAAKAEARKMGGNVLKVTKHLYPSLASTCHQIEGLVLKVNDFNDTSFISASKPDTTIAVKPKKNPGWRGAINGGWSWRTAKIADGLNDFQKDYFSNLKSGYQFGAEAHYFFNEGFGLGLLYNLYHSSYSTMAAAELPNGQTVTGELSDKINIHYIAPSVYWRVLSKSKMNAFLFGLSIGYMSYTDEGYWQSPYQIKGSTVGFSYDIGYDIGLSKHTALGLGVGWKLGVLSSITATNDGQTEHISLDEDHREGLAHLDLSLGLRFR
jgi:hypothetical protein